MTNTAEQPEAKYGFHKGLPIVERTVEVRGMEGGFSKGASVQAAPDDVTQDFYFAGKGRPKGERYDFLVANEKSRGWKLFGPDDGKPEAVRQVHIATVLGAGYADEGLVGDAVHAFMEAAANAEAERKLGQASFGVSVPEGAEGEEGTISPLRRRAKKEGE